MEAAYFSQMLVTIYHTARYYILENHNLYAHIYFFILILNC
jgi:hypothetical protein